MYGCVYIDVFKLGNLTVQNIAHKTIYLLHVCQIRCISLRGLFIMNTRGKLQFITDLYIHDITVNITKFGHDCRFTEDGPFYFCLFLFDIFI